jgi:hypothetical protein
MINYSSKDLNQTLFILTELEISIESQSDTSLSVLGVFSTYDKALKVKNERIDEKNIKEKYCESNFEVKNVSFCYEIIGNEGYFYQLLIIEQTII